MAASSSTDPGRDRLPPFAELRVVDRGGTVATAYAAKLFADLGARVSALPTDRLSEAQLHYLRRHVTVGSDDRAVATADVVIDADDHPPAPGHADDLGPGVVNLRLGHHGRAGPYASWRGTDLTDYALGGHLYLYGHPDRAPLQGPANQPAIAAGLFGFVGTMAALLARPTLGAGQTVEVGHMEAMVALHQFTLIRYTMTGDVLRRMGNRFTGQGQPNGLYRCADGWVAIAAPTDPQVESLLDATGLGHLLDDPRIESVMDFQTNPAVLDDALAPWLAERTVEEVTDLFQAMRVPTAPAPTMSGLLDDPQLAERDLWEVDDGLRLPRSPLRFGHRQPSGGRRWTPGPFDDGPLSGLRVLDLTRVWAGPLCTRLLADLGADVVCVEAPWARGPQRLPASIIEATRYFPDDDPGPRPWNRNTHLVKYGLGKRSLVLDLDQEAGRELLAELLPGYDVLIENFSPRVMPNLGFDEERLHRLNPDLIYVTMPGYGRSGPAVDWLAYGSSVDSHAGLSSLIGYDDAHPWKGGVAWPDPMAGLHAAGGLLKALWDREADPGRGGVTVEQAQFESTVAVIGDRLIEAQLDGDPGPPGNRHPHYRAQGVYPCAGDDRWVAISIIDDEALRAVAELADLDPTLFDRTGFDRTGPDRTGLDHDRFDEALAAWTSDQDQHRVAERLQAVGVAAAPVLDAAGLLDDPHLAAVDAFAHLDQPEVGPFTTPRMPIGFSATPGRIRRPAPTLGQHNREVLEAELGLGPDRLRALLDAGVLADEPPA